MSASVISRADFQQLADARLAEAKALLDLGMWDEAYYLAGYAVELALKACIIKKMMATDAFPEKQFSVNCYSHRLVDLVNLAGLDAIWTARIKADPLFETYWNTVKAWSEQKRYHRIEESEARMLYDSIADSTNGVLPWVRLHY